MRNRTHESSYYVRKRTTKSLERQSSRTLVQNCRSATNHFVKVIGDLKDVLHGETVNPFENSCLVLLELERLIKSDISFEDSKNVEGEISVKTRTLVFLVCFLFLCVPLVHAKGKDISSKSTTGKTKSLVGSSNKSSSPKVSPGGSSIGLKKTNNKNKTGLESSGSGSGMRGLSKPGKSKP